MLLKNSQINSARDRILRPIRRRMLKGSAPISRAEFDREFYRVHAGIAREVRPWLSHWQDEQKADRFARKYRAWAVLSVYASILKDAPAATLTAAEQKRACRILAKFAPLARKGAERAEAPKALRFARKLEAAFANPRQPGMELNAHNLRRACALIYQYRIVQPHFPPLKRMYLNDLRRKVSDGFEEVRYSSVTKRGQKL